MEDTAALIRAIAALAWPLVVVFIVIRYDSQVRDLLGRIKRGKIAGAEIELSEKLDSLVASASEAASDADLLAAGAPAIILSSQGQALNALSLMRCRGLQKLHYYFLHRKSIDPLGFF